MKATLHFQLIIATLFTISSAYAGGDLPMPHDVRGSYERGNRSFDGTPGANYWQNRADYDIRINVLMNEHRISGEEAISYQNNSPDTLRSLVLKLYLNMNRKGARRMAEIGEEALTDGMSLTSLSVNGIVIDLNPAARQAVLDGPVLNLVLPKSLAPGAAARLEASWTTAIPKAEGESWENPRMGWFDRDAMFLAYFYPRIAVYDDVSGWDDRQYDGVHEFYHDYGTFDLSVTLPSGYGVWSTGTLQNPGDVLPPLILSRLEAALRSDTTVHIVSQTDLASKVYGSVGERTWRFRADNVSDVACGIGTYLWDALGTEVADGRRVLVQSVYHPAAATFTTVAQEQAEALRTLSGSFPGVPYEYPLLTVFHGLGGMEFPMILNDGEFESRIAHVFVHAHETAHSWMPFMVGINETSWGWMEEGMAYFLPIDVQVKQSGYDHRIRAAQGYASFSGRIEDYPLMVPSSASPFNEWQMLDYYKACVAFDMLRRTLGEDRFTAALRDFITSWQGKHPLPWDFFNTFNRVSGTDLSWFWLPWFFEQGRPDLALESVNQEGATVRLDVRRKGSMPVPIDATLQLENGESIEINENASVWKDGDRHALSTTINGKVTAVTLGNKYIPDADQANNTWKR